MHIIIVVSYNEQKEKSVTYILLIQRTKLYYGNKNQYFTDHSFVFLRLWPTITSGS